jgi:2-oxoisovalerate dehydrogenase E1 component
VPYGQPHIEGKGTDLCILTYGNGYYLSRKAAKILQDEHAINLRVVDLRWLVPLHKEAIVKAIGKSKSVLIVDECRRSGSVSEELMTLLMESDLNVPASRITAYDSFIPLGSAAYEVLPSVEDIIDAALGAVKGSS